MAQKVASTYKYTEDWLPVKTIQNGMILTKSNYKVTGVKISPKNIFILDPDVYMSNLQLKFNEATSPAIRKLIAQDIQKGENFINNNIVDTEYYFLFKDKNVDLLQKRVRMMINGLASCGLNASQTSNEDLRVILENFLNGGNRTEFGTVMPV